MSYYQGEMHVYNWYHKISKNYGIDPEIIEENARKLVFFYRISIERDCEKAFEQFSYTVLKAPYVNISFETFQEFVQKYLHRKLDFDIYEEFSQEIQQLWKSPEVKSGVYFLMYGEKDILYVGYSKDVHTRSYTSFREKQQFGIDKIGIIYTETDSDARILEQYYICNLSPILNKSKPIEGDTPTVMLEDIKINTFNIYKKNN